MKTPLFCSGSSRRFLVGCATILTALTTGVSAHAQTAGVADPAFSVGAGADSGAVRALALQPDGKIIVGGSFGTFEGSTSQGIVRLKTDGTLDPSFNATGTGIDSGGDNGVFGLAVQPDGKIIAVGLFSMYNGASHANVVRLNTDGGVDPNFVGSTDARALAVVLQPDGGIVIGGTFDTVSGVAVNSAIARMTTNGGEDSTFNTTLIPYGDTADGFFDNEVESLALQSDGKIIAGGNFDTGNFFNLARINVNGTADAAFATDYAPTGEVYSIAIQSNGQIIVGGPFLNTNTIQRLNTDGNLDTTFAPDLGVDDYEPDALAIQADGKILVGGSPDFSDGPQGVVRLAADGTYDASYSANNNIVGGEIHALAIDSSNNALAGGDYASYNDLYRVVGGALSASPTPTPNPTGTATVTISPASVKGSETGGAIKVVVTRTGDTSSALTVFYTAKGSAVAKTNYKALPGSVIIPAGSATAVIKIKPRDDHSPDGTHVLKLTLVAGDGYTVGTAAKTKVKIVNAD